MFGAFGRILLSSDILTAGNQFVFTFESGEWFFLGSTSTIRSGLAERMANFGEVVSVTRGLFSDRYIVTVVSTINAALSDWLSVFDVSWRDMGYDNITFVAAEGGAVSSQPGGLIEMVPQIGEIGVSALKPIFPYILGFLAVYLAITLLPTLTRRTKRYA